MGYSPPTPTPKTKSKIEVDPNNRFGLSVKMKLTRAKPMAPAHMNDAVVMPPILLPIKLAEYPNKIIPVITPNTTEYVNEPRSRGEQT